MRRYSRGDPSYPTGLLALTFRSRDPDTITISTEYEALTLAEAIAGQHPHVTLVGPQYIQGTWADHVVKVADGASKARAAASAARAGEAARLETLTRIKALAEARGVTLPHLSPYAASAQISHDTLLDLLTPTPAKENTTMLQTLIKLDDYDLQAVITELTAAWDTGRCARLWIDAGEGVKVKAGEGTWSLGYGTVERRP